MNSTEFINFGVEMLQYITTYLDGIRERRVVPTVNPGYLRDLIPAEVPEDGEPWEEIMKDIERVVMPGITHWHSPQFHAYFAAANSYPAIVADMLSGAIGCIGFNWIASPACTELEVVMLDWLGKLIGLPSKFLASESNGEGGGVIQGSASEATLMALLTARTRALKRFETKEEDVGSLMGKLVAYTSDQSHSSVERSGCLAGIKMKKIQTDAALQMKGIDLEKVVLEDKANGLIPFYVVATLGTTNSCAFDHLDEIGEVCRKHDLWLHVDAAYAGSAFVCSEYRYLMKGIERVDSFNISPHKWLLVNFDCSAMWYGNAKEVSEAHDVDPLYLRYDTEGTTLPDYRHWQIPLGRRFRSLKLWFVFRSYGKKKLQAHIRHHVSLAKHFERLMRKDERFEISAPVVMGLVCFHLKNKTQAENEKLLKTLIGRGNIYLVPSKLHEQYVLRFAVCSKLTTIEDIEMAWNEIQLAATEMFKP